MLMTCACSFVVSLQAPKTRGAFSAYFAVSSGVCPNPIGKIEAADPRFVHPTPATIPHTAGIQS